MTSTDHDGETSCNTAAALAMLDARLGGFRDLRHLLSQAVAETASLRRAVARQRKFRSQELVIARYAAIYQYIQLSQPDFPLGRLLADERVRTFTCGCPEGACEHVEYIAKRLSYLSSRAPGRPSTNFPDPAMRSGSTIPVRTNSAKAQIP